MQGPDFLYFLMNDQNQFYYINGTQVLTSGMPKPLTYTPDGWQDISIFFERNKKYFAIDRSFTIPMNFVEDGARILKYLFYVLGVEAPCYLMIAEQVLDFDGTTFGFRYQKMYKGQIDFSTFKHIGPKVTVNIMEGELVKLIKAYESTEYEIPLDTPEAIQIEMDGLKLKKSANYSTLDIELTGAGLVVHTPPITFLNEEGFNVGISFDSENFGDTTPDIVHNQTGQDITFNISGSVPFQTEYGSHQYKLEIRRRRVDNSNEILFQDTLNVSDNVQYSIPFNLDVTLLNGEQLFFVGFYLADVSPANLDRLKMKYFAADIKVSLDFTYRTTTIKAYQPLVLLQKLIAKVTNGKYQATSSLLASNLNMLTSGDGLRGLSGAVIKISLLKFFKLFDLLEDAAMGIRDNTLVFETKKYWYDESTVIDLGSVSNLQVSQATDYLFSAINIGFPNQNYNIALGDVNGKLEPSVTQTYTTGITCVQNVLDLTTDVRGDMFGIEFTRINLDHKTTTDSSSDNNSFVIRCAPLAAGETVYKLDRSLNQYASIVIDPSYNMDAATQTQLINAFDKNTAFNLAITPKQCLYKKSAFIHGCLRSRDASYLTYQVSDKFPLLKVAVPGQRVVYERDNVRTGDLDQPYFTDILYEFETKVPINLQDVLNVNPIQAFQYEYQGVVQKGINQKIGMQPAVQKSQTWQLLGLPENDLSQLIEVWI